MTAARPCVSVDKSNPASAKIKRLKRLQKSPDVQLQLADCKRDELNAISCVRYFLKFLFPLLPRPEPTTFLMPKREGQGEETDSTINSSSRRKGGRRGSSSPSSVWVGSGVSISWDEHKEECG